MVAANPDVARRIARMLHEFARRGAAHDLARKACRNMNPPLANDRGAGIAPQLDRLRIAANLQTDLLEQAVRVCLDGLQPFG